MADADLISTDAQGDLIRIANCFSSVQRFFAGVTVCRPILHEDELGERGEQAALDGASPSEFTDGAIVELSGDERSIAAPGASGGKPLDSVGLQALRCQQFLRNEGESVALGMTLTADNAAPGYTQGTNPGEIRFESFEAVQLKLGASADTLTIKHADGKASITLKKGGEIEIKADKITLQAQGVKAELTSDMNVS